MIELCPVGVHVCAYVLTFADVNTRGMCYNIRPTSKDAQTNAVVDIARIVAVKPNTTGSTTIATWTLTRCP